MNWRPLCMVLLVILNFEISGQESSPGEKIERYLESLAEYSGDTEMISDITDEIDKLLENRVRINSASEAEISRLFFLSFFQIRSLADYIRKEGGVISASEISYIPGFDEELARLIEPFILITFNEPEIRTARLSVNGLINYVSKSNYSEQGSPGPPFKMLVKTDFSWGRFQSGISSEKDQGERIFTAHTGPDFFSGYISWSNSGIIKNVIVGDIRVRFGQGLVSWSGYPLASTPLSTGLMRAQASISPYRSSDENRFFRGAGISVGNNKHNFLAYMSGNRIDATIENSDGEPAIKSFYTTGLHNSYSTIAKRDMVTEYSGGFSYTINRNIFHAGLSFASTRFSLPVYRDSTIENLFDFSGLSNISASLDYSLSLNRLYLFGELAKNYGGGIAYLGGAKIIPATGTAINILFTNIGKGYNSIHGIGSGRETLNRFQKSLIMNFSFEPLKNTYVICGILYKRDLWYGLYGAPPSASRRFETDIRYSPSEVITINTSCRVRLNENDEKAERGMRYNSEEGYTNFRANIKITPSGALTFQSRLELILNRAGGYSGYLLLNGFKTGTSPSGLSLSGRVYVWSTGDYDSRLYAWEDDLLYTSSILPYYNSGSRSYLMMTYRKSSKLSLRLKIGFTQMSYPSGELRSYNEIKVQARFRIY